MSSCYPQVERAEALIPLVERIAPSFGLDGRKARPFLDALSVDVVVRLDNAVREWRGLDTEFRSMDLRFSAHQVFLGAQEPVELEDLVRTAFESMQRRPD